MTRVTRPHHRRTGGSTRHDPATLVAAIVAIVAVLGSVVAWQPSADAGLAAPAPDCTIPETEREVARPEDLAARYEYASLHESGHDGRGLVAAQLQFGQSVGLEEFRFFQQCLDLRQMPVTQWRFADGAATEIATGDTASLPAPGREAQSDLEIIAGAAPGLDHVHVLVAEPGAPFIPTLTAMLRTLADGSATGGRPPDIVSMSYGICEAQLTTSEMSTVNDALATLANGGTWFFKGAGDSGSTDCVPKSECQNTDAPVSVHFPASSPWVTSVGGTEVLKAHTGGTPLTGTARVWNAKSRVDTDCSAGGGGLSTAARPSWQDVVPGGSTLATRGVPDIAALAGRPYQLTYLPPVVPAGNVDDPTASPSVPATWSWVGNGGDSLSGPLMAGAFASLRSALIATGVEVPTLVNPMLYEIASNAGHYARVFADITEGDNAINTTVCCTAGAGYDLTSGLGEIRIAALLAVLSEPKPAPVTPSFTG